MIKIVPKFTGNEDELNIPIIANCISPDIFKGKDVEDIKALKVFHGNKEKNLGDLFEVTSTGEDEQQIVIDGNVSIVRHIGEAMSSGKIVINGNCGMHLGAQMGGGEVVVNGSAGDWLGAEMQAGFIKVKGNCGNLAGSAYRGGSAGMNGGIIIIEGNAGNEIGTRQRGGSLVVMGDAGDFTGVHMRGGTIVCFGKPGKRTGGNMTDGTIIVMQTELEMLPTFKANSISNPVFVRAFLNQMQNYMEIPQNCIDGLYKKFSGDFSERPGGEIFVFEGG